MRPPLSTAIVVLVGLFDAVVGVEKHTVRFNNICGIGTPMLIQDEHILSHGEPYTVFGPLISAIAYLQTDDCGFNGEHCTLVETTLEDLSSDGSNSGSMTDINVRPPHRFNFAASFNYVGGCEGEGAFCNGPNCKPAPVSCEVDNVNLTITFCVKPVPRATRLAHSFANLGPGRNV